MQGAGRAGAGSSDGDGEFSGARGYTHCWVPVLGEAAFPGGVGGTAGADGVPPAGREGEGCCLSLLPGIQPLLVTIPVPLTSKNKMLL